MQLINTKDKGYSLIEILIALMIFTTVMISAIAIMLRSAIISFDNDTAERAKNVGVKVLELSKKPDGRIANCSRDQSNQPEYLDINVIGSYAVSDVDLSGNTADFADEICIEAVEGSSYIANTAEPLISECENQYETNVILPDNTQNNENFTYREYDENYCIQILIEEVPDSDFRKITVNILYDSFQGETRQRLYYGFR